MHSFDALKNKRWFIWCLVSIIVFGTLLTLYIVGSEQTDQALSNSTTFTHHHKISETEAVRLVANLPEIKQIPKSSLSFSATLAGTNGSNAYWNVEAYQNMRSLRKVYGFYAVSQITGNITKIQPDEIRLK